MRNLVRALPPEELIQFEGYTIDRPRFMLQWKDEPVPLNRKTFDLLLHLVEYRDRVVTKDELLKALWPDQFVEESNLTQHIFLLRKALSRHESGGKIIETIPGRGYRFAATVVAAPHQQITIGLTESITRITIEEEEDFSEPAAIELSKASLDRSPKRYRYLRPVLITLFAIIGCSCGLILYRHFHKIANTQSAPSAPVANSEARQSIAVLGFRNSSSHPEDAWLSTAVSEMLASEMSAGDKLRVIPNEDLARAQSDLGIKGSPVDSEAERTKLRQATGADMLVQGSYVVVGQGSAPALRLMVQVQNAHSGKQLASFSETGKLGDLFALVDQAGAELRKDLSQGVSQGDEEQALSGMSHSTEALRFYAEGVERELAFDSHSAQSFFERAIEADPKFAMAHLGLAEVWADLGFMERAARESAEAYKLSANLPRAERLAVEADDREFSKDYEHAISIYKSLSTFYPDDQTWGLRLASLQRKDGRRKEAVETLERVRNLPLTPAELVDLDGIEAVSYAHIEDPSANDKARALLKQAIAIADKQGGLFIHGRAFRWECFAMSHIGPVPDAQAACERSKATFQAIGNLQGVEAATNNLGVIAQQVGDWKQAEADYEDARQLDHQLGNLEYEVMMVLNLAQLDLAQGDLANTLKESGQLIHMNGTSDDYHIAFNGHFFAAWALLQSGRLREAKLEALEAQRSADKEHPWDFKVDEQAHAREVLGWIALRSGDATEAQRLFREALTLNEPTHDEADKAVFTVDEAATVPDQGNPGKAVMDRVQQAIEVLAKLQDHSDDAIEAGLTLTRLDLQSGAMAEASQAMAKARALDSKGDSVAVHFDVLLGDADLQQSLGHTVEARGDLQQVVTAAKAKGYAYYDLAGEIALAKLDAKMTPSVRNTSRLQALAQQSDRVGFRGLAHEAR